MRVTLTGTILLAGLVSFIADTAIAETTTTRRTALSPAGAGGSVPDPISKK
jgi:hypothetical protein